MARWVKSHNQMTVFKQTATPAVVDGLHIGDIWIDTTSGAVLKVCTAVSPVTFIVGSSLGGYATTATAAATTTLTANSAETQIFTGSTTQSVVLPVVSTLAPGTPFTIVNLSSGVVTVKSSGSNTIQTMQANSTLTVLSNAITGTDQTVWHITGYMPAASGQTGSGSLVRATSPALVTPNIGAATGNSLQTTSAILSGSVSGGLAGNMAMYSSDAAKGGLEFLAVNNTANYFVTISNAAYGQASTLTIPDVGAATGKFIMSTGAGQTIGNGLTLTTPILGAASATSVAFTSTSGIIGSTTNDAAASLSVGQYVESTILLASVVSLTDNTETNLTSISLTAGDWDVWGNILLTPAATTNITQYRCGISTTSATRPDNALNQIQAYGAGGLVTGGVPLGGVAPSYRISIAGTTTVYMVVYTRFSVDTLGVTGGIYARRRR